MPALLLAVLSAAFAAPATFNVTADVIGFFDPEGAIEPGVLEIGDALTGTFFLHEGVPDLDFGTVHQFESRPLPSPLALLKDGIPVLDIAPGTLSTSLVDMTYAPFVLVNHDMAALPPGSVGAYLADPTGAFVFCEFDDAPLTGEFPGVDLSGLTGFCGADLRNDAGTTVGVDLQVTFTPGEAPPTAQYLSLDAVIFDGLGAGERLTGMVYFDTEPDTSVVRLVDWTADLPTPAVFSVGEEVRNLADLTAQRIVFSDLDAGLGHDMSLTVEGVDTDGVSVSVVCDMDMNFTDVYEYPFALGDFSGAYTCHWSDDSGLEFSFGVEEDLGVGSQVLAVPLVTCPAGTDTVPEPVCPSCSLGTFNPDAGGTCEVCPAGWTEPLGSTTCLDAAPPFVCIDVPECLTFHLNLPVFLPEHVGPTYARTGGEDQIVVDLCGVEQLLGPDETVRFDGTSVFAEYPDAAGLPVFITLTEGDLPDTFTYMLTTDPASELPESVEGECSVGDVDEVLVQPTFTGTMGHRSPRLSGLLADASASHLNFFLELPESPDETSPDSASWVPDGLTYGPRILAVGPAAVRYSILPSTVQIDTTPDGQLLAIDYTADLSEFPGLEGEYPARITCDLVSDVPYVPGLLTAGTDLGAGDCVVTFDVDGELLFVEWSIAPGDAVVTEPGPLACAPGTFAAPEGGCLSCPQGEVLEGESCTPCDGAHELEAGQTCIPVDARLAITSTSLDALGCARLNLALDLPSAIPEGVRYGLSAPVQGDCDGLAFTLNVPSVVRRGDVLEVGGLAQDGALLPPFTAVFIELPLEPGDAVDVADVVDVFGGTWSTTTSDGVTTDVVLAAWGLFPQVTTLYPAFPGDLMTITVDHLPEDGRLWAMAGTEIGDGACPPYLGGACFGVTGRTFFAFGRSAPWSVEPGQETIAFAPPGFAGRGEGGVHLFASEADRSGIMDLGVVPFE